MEGEKIHREDEEVKENRGSCERRRQWRETGELSLTTGWGDIHLVSGFSYKVSMLPNTLLTSSVTVPCHNGTGENCRKERQQSMKERVRVKRRRDEKRMERWRGVSDKEVIRLVLYSSCGHCVLVLDLSPWEDSLLHLLLSSSSLFHLGCMGEIILAFQCCQKGCEFSAESTGLVGEEGKTGMDTGGGGGGVGQRGEERRCKVKVITDRWTGQVIVSHR